MRIYVIGPISGFDDLNVPAFENARVKLRCSGYVPLIPHDFVPSNADWQQAMRRSLECIAKADGIAYIDGWQASHGARLEWKIARKLGIEVASVDSWCTVASRRVGLTSRLKERRQCPLCKRVLPLDLFDRSSGKTDEREGCCRDCLNDPRREERGREQE